MAAEEYTVTYQPDISKTVDDKGVQTVKLMMTPEQITGLQVLAQVMFNVDTDLHMEIENDLKENITYWDSGDIIESGQLVTFTDHSETIDQILGRSDLATTLNRFIYLYNIHIRGESAMVLGSKTWDFLEGFNQGADLFHVNWKDYIREIYDRELHAYQQL